jgi:hypothetical protein
MDTSETQAAHRYFSAQCFNEAWDLIDKPGRTPEEERRMVALCHASIHHWLCRPDCTDRNRSIGYWQASRVEAVLGNAEQARRWGEVCLEYSRELGPFLLGYAHEALARAAMLAGDRDVMERHLDAAHGQAACVEEPDDREALLKDLDDVI